MRSIPEINFIHVDPRGFEHTRHERPAGQLCYKVGTYAFIVVRRML